MHHHEETKNVEFEILEEIKKAESRSAHMIENAKREKESIISKAQQDASKLILEKQEEILKSQDRKISEFREKSKLIREEKLGEAKIQVRQLKAKSDKNMQKAVDIVIQKIDAIVG